MDRAAMLAKQHGAELLVVHVLEPTEDILAAQARRFSPLPAMPDLWRSPSESCAATCARRGTG
jgi:hypothetical protein